MWVTTIYVWRSSVRLTTTAVSMPPTDMILRTGGALRLAYVREADR